jgi:hypothetical protein
MAVFRLGLFTLLLWLVGGVHFPAFAAATNVQFCNQYPHTVRFAAAWNQGGTMRSRGWWPVATRHCTSVSVPANSFFWRAEMRYDNGSSTVSGAWGDRGHRSSARRRRPLRSGTLMDRASRQVRVKGT